MKNKNEKIYDDFDMFDIEFYSPDPIKDMIELCDFLQEKKYNFIRGSEAEHDETFTISINTVKYCDITFMSKEIYNNIPVIKVDDYIFIDPIIMLIDKYRVFSNIIMYWRLEKDFIRALLIIKYFPLNLVCSENIESINSDLEKNYNNYILSESSEINKYNKQNVILQIINELWSENCVFFGDIWDIFYFEKKIKSYEDFSNQLKCIYIYTDNLYNISSKVYSILLNNVKLFNLYEYNKFFQFFDKRIEFIFYLPTYNKFSTSDNLYHITIFSNNNICVPHNTMTYTNDKNKIIDLKIASFDFIVLNYLIYYVYNYYIKKKNYLYYSNKLMKYLNYRNNYFKENNLSIFDKSIFSWFIINCTGKSIKQIKLKLLHILDNKKNNRPLIISYNPLIDNKNSIMYNKKFNNMDGWLNEGK